MSNLIRQLEDCGALQFGKFTLASGAESNYYVDIKKASTDPKVLKTIAEDMAGMIGKDCPDRIAGVVLGSIPLAAALSLKTGIPFVMVRKERKNHGTGKLVEGDMHSGESVLVIEDVITTAGSSVKAVKTLRLEGAKVTRVLSVIDREGGGRENLADMGVELTSLIKGSELLGATIQ